MRKREETTHIIIHTAAAAHNGKAIDQSARTIRDYHVNVLGWSDIGYHYVIRFDGSIEKGRPESLQGAHCRDMGMNRKAIGICCSGHGDIKPFTPQQVDTLCSLVNILRERKSIPLSHVLGHRETGAAKTCPGTLVDMNDLRAEIDQQQIIDGSWTEIKDYDTLAEKIAFVTGKLDYHG